MKNRPIWVQEIIDNENIFKKDKYPLFSDEEKISYWGAGLHRGMRWQAESGYDEYAIYTQHWLEGVLAQEPRFMELLPNIYSLWGASFDSEKVDTIIQRLYKQINLLNKE